MEEPIIVGIDIGTSKICTLVARVEEGDNLRILGVGIEPSQGIRKGTVVDLNAAALAVSRSIEKAERTSGFEINAALVSLAGSQVSSINSRGVVGITGGIVDIEDIDRALDAAQAVAIPHNREIIHVIQRGFTIDGQDASVPRSACTATGWKLKPTSSPPLPQQSKTFANASVPQGSKCSSSCSIPWPPVKWCSQKRSARWVWPLWISAAEPPTWRSTLTAMSGTPW